MDTLELPLVFFTVLTQLAVGMSIFAALRQWAPAEGAWLKARNEWITILSLVVLAVLAAFLHLGRPFGFIRMLANLQTAWLSREILMFGLFGFMTAVTLFMVLRKAASSWLIKLTALVGLLAAFATGMAYASAGLDAIHNYLPLVLFYLTVFILGPAVASYFVDEAGQATMRTLLLATLLAGAVVYFVIPFVWLSGSAVMAQTGAAFLQSPLHWLHLLVLLAGLVVLGFSKRIPTWLPILLVLGELLGRVAFFALMVSSGSHLGGLF